MNISTRRALDFECVVVLILGSIVGSKICHAILSVSHSLVLRPLMGQEWKYPARSAVSARASMARPLFVLVMVKCYKFSEASFVLLTGFYIFASRIHPSYMLSMPRT